MYSPGEVCGGCGGCAPQGEVCTESCQRQEGGINLGMWGGTLSRAGVWKDPEDLKHLCPHLTPITIPWGWPLFRTAVS